MGWLGWTEKATLNADMNAIEVAYKGRIEMLQAIFGTGDKAPSNERPPKDARGEPIVFTASHFDTLFPLPNKPHKIRRKLPQARH